MIRIDGATPFPFRFDLARTALVIIDMQRDFIEPGGFGASLGNDVTRLQAIVPTVQAVLSAWRRAGGFIVHTREGHAPDLSDCPPAKRQRGTPTLRIGDDGPMGRALVVDKPGKGAFHATGLQQALQARGVTHLVLMGVTTEVCVQTTMREANDRGYEVLLVEDGTESYFPEFKAATLAMLTAQGGIVGWTAPAAALLAALATPALAAFQSSQTDSATTP